MPDLSESPEIKRLEKNITTELLWIYILAILKKGSMHAYALREQIQGKFGFKPGNVSAYVVLYKLESRGFVKGRHVGNRKVYSITESGRELLKEADRKIASCRELVFC